MRKILVTGGTVFVSRFIAEYYVAKGDEVYVLNRNTRPQSAGVRYLFWMQRDFRQTGMQSVMHCRDCILTWWLIRHILWKMWRIC